MWFLKLYDQKGEDKFLVLHKGEIRSAIVSSKPQNYTEKEKSEIPHFIDWLKTIYEQYYARARDLEGDAGINQAIDEELARYVTALFGVAQQQMLGRNTALDEEMASAPYAESPERVRNLIKDLHRRGIPMAGYRTYYHEDTEEP